VAVHESGKPASNGNPQGKIVQNKHHDTNKDFSKNKESGKKTGNLASH